jgi:iron complex outermembrane receptor protein
MDDLRATVSGGVDTSICGVPSGPNLYSLEDNRVCISAGGGNPQLQPYEADSFDVSFEHYFADGGGYVSVAAFYKDLSDFIFGNETRVVDYGDVGRQALINVGMDPSYIDANPQFLTGTASAPIKSSGGGHIQGLEFALSAPGDAFLPEGWLQGFGFLASLSLTDSEIEPTPGFILEIPGLSEEVSNFTVYYENGGFEARVSQRSRSEFLGEVTGFGANREFRDIQPEDVVDAQLAYSFEDGGRFDGLSVYLQGNNLTNERFGSFLNDDPRQVKDYQEYGATYLIGINWRR